MKLTRKKIFLSKRLRQLGNFTFASFCLFLLFDISQPLPKEKPWSTMVFSGDSTLLGAYLSSDDKWRMQTKDEDVSPEFLTALFSKEDRWFYYHPGVNPIAIGRALLKNIFKAKRTSGASTLTMQTVKMMQPRKRTYFNKLLEIIKAVQLEWHFSKNEILSLYLSYLPYGSNIEGVNAASYLYFNRSPKALSLAQNILLTVIPNRPNSLRPDRFPVAVKQSRNFWIEKFKKEKIFPDNILNHAAAEPILQTRNEIPLLAPHFTRMLTGKETKAKIYASLDLRIQETTQKMLANHCARVKGKGISNGAVLVIKNADHSVAAWCGSADFNDPESLGQVDGILGLRSPGSTLKPFLFALAIDKGLITPKSIIYDIPGNYGGFSPENYDLKFRGAVTIEYALRNSLNIPSVEILTQTGKKDFLKTMDLAGLKSISENSNQLGLSVILGGCGTTLEELTQGFSVFASNGNFIPLAFTKEKENISIDSISVFSPESSWLIAEMLSGIERPDIPNDYLSLTQKQKIAWKTGTSFGKRDAWAIGFNKEYTIGVWMGNFDGKAAPDLSGAGMAVPLLFDVFNGLPYPIEKTWFEKPIGIQERDICKNSGMVAGAMCIHQTKDYFSVDQSSRKICDMERELYIKSDSSLQYCTECLPESGWEKAWFSVYPPSYTLWLSREKISYPKPPPHNPKCSARFSGAGPTITSPSASFEYLVEKGLQQKILMQAASDATVKTHYWYINHTFYKQVNAGEALFFEATKGIYHFACMDEFGRKNEVVVKINHY